MGGIGNFFCLFTVCKPFGQHRLNLYRGNILAYFIVKLSGNRFANIFLNVNKLFGQLFLIVQFGLQIFVGFLQLLGEAGIGG